MARGKVIVGVAANSGRQVLSRAVDEDPSNLGEDELEALSGPKQTLDQFLVEQFEESKTGNELGMPPLKWLKEQFQTKSARIRYLHAQNFKVKDIAKHLNIRYQHVRNVLSTELKRGPNENFKIDDYRSPNIGIEPTEDEE
jgi:hypothetical protein